MDREYQIIIKNETGTKSGAVAGQQQSEDTAKDKKQLSPAQVATAKGLVAWKKAEGFINQLASYEVSQVELRTGSKEYAQKVQLVYDVAMQALGLGESLAMGYAVGNLPGAIIATVAHIGSTLITYAQNQNTINTKRSLENQSIQMNYIRAGARGSRGQE